MRRTPYHFLMPIIQTNNFFTDIYLDVRDGFIPLGMPLKFLEWMRDEWFPMYVNSKVFSQHPLPSIQGDELILSAHDGRVPFLEWISQELHTMSTANFNLQMYMQEIPAKIPNAHAQLAELSKISQIIQLKIQENHQKIHIQTTKVFPSSIKIISALKLQLMQSVNPVALNALTQSIFEYQTRCQDYIRSCRALCLLFEAFSKNPHMQPIHRLVLQTIQALVEEIKLFELTISKPLESLVSGQAEQTFLHTMSENVTQISENFMQLVKRAFIFTWIVTVGFVILYAYFLWAFPVLI